MNPPNNSLDILDAREISRALERMAGEIIALAGGTSNVVLVGIQRRGAELAERLGAFLQRDGGTVPLGALDITLYRDDLRTIGPAPVVGETRIPMDLTEKFVVIVDDVLYTGRTVRAALDAVEHARTIVQRELGAVTDNPLVLEPAGGFAAPVVSAGNFHGMPLAAQLDCLVHGRHENRDLF